MTRNVCLVVLSLLATSTAMADSIVVDGMAYTGVYIRESPSTYYVQIPEQGSVRHVSKSAVESGDVVFSESEEERAALLALWRRNNEAQDKARGLLPYSAASTTAAPTSSPTMRPGRPSAVFDAAHASTSVPCIARPAAMVTP